MTASVVGAEVGGMSRWRVRLGERDTRCMLTSIRG